MEAPFCKPWTTRVRLFGATSWVVGSPYPVEVQALGPDGLLSTSENRPLVLQIRDPTGRITVVSSIRFQSGVGTLNISYTIAHSITLQLRGNDFMGIDLDTMEVLFVAGATARYAFVDTSLEGTVDAPARAEVRALDRFGNLNTKEQRGLSVSWGTSHTVLLDNFANGVGSALIRATQPGSFAVTLAGALHPTADVSDAATVNVRAGVPRRVRFALPAGAAATAGAWFSVPLVAEDQFGNTATSASPSVSVVMSRGSGGGLTSLAAGVGSVAVRAKVARPIELSLQDSQVTGMDVSAQVMLRVVAAAGSQFVLQAPFQQGTVDAPLEVEIVALDDFGNVASGTDATVDLRATGVGVSGAGAVMIRGGRGVMKVGSTKAQDVGLTLVDSYASGLDCSATLSLNFAAGAPAKINLVAGAASVVGGSVSLELSAFDSHGNALESYSSRVSLRTSGQASIVGDGVALLVNGKASVDVSNTRAESIQVTMEDTFGIGLDLSAKATALFLPAPAVRFAFGASPGEVSVDGPVSVEVRALDRYGNLADSYGGAVTVSASSGASVAGAVGIVAGRGTAEISTTTAGSVTLSLVDSAGTGLATAGASMILLFVGGSAHSISMDAAAPSGSVDEPIPVELRALDRHGNLASRSTVVISLRQTGAHVSQQDVAFNEGMAFVNILSVAAGTVDVALRDFSGLGLNCSARLSLTFFPGAPARVSMDAPTSIRAGDGATVNVTVSDKHGNLATSPTSSRVTLVSDPPAMLSNDGNLELRSGFALVTVTHSVAEVIALSLSTAQTSLDVSVRRNIAILAGIATSYMFPDPQITASVDDGARVYVHAVDRFGNLAVDQHTDVGVTIANEPNERVAFSSGRGLVRLSRVTPGVVALGLVDLLGTSLDVSSRAEVEFVPGAARTLALGVPQVASTVDVPLATTLTAMDRHGNVATGENRTFEVVTTSSRVSGVGRVALSSGRAEVSVLSELPQTVRVRLRDIMNTGVDCSATVVLTFAVGALYRFSLRSSTGELALVERVNATAQVHASAEDRFGNIIEDVSGVTVEADLRPLPAELANGAITWRLENGLAVRPFMLSKPASFEAQVTRASGGAAGLPLDAAVARASPFRLEFRLDLTPPSYRNLHLDDVTSSTVSFRVLGISEPSRIWCVVLPDNAPPPAAFISSSDGAVFSALRGGSSAIPNSTVASANVGRVERAAPIIIKGLSPALTYIVRCAAADDSGNFLAAAHVLSLQVVFSTPPPAVAASAGESESFISSPFFIVPMVVSFLAVIVLLFAVYYFVLARRTMSNAVMRLSKVVPLAEAGRKIQDAFQSVVSIGPPSKDPPALVSAVESDTDSEDDGKQAKAEEESRLLEQALAMKQQLAEELERRGFDATAADDLGDSSVSGDSETEGVLRDVKAFVRKEAEAPGSSQKMSDLKLPDLPLMLPEADEQRLATLLALAQAEGDFEAKLAAFDAGWRDASTGGAFEEARDRLRGEQQEYRERALEAERQLAEASEALERLPEEIGTRFVDALAADEEAVAKETDDWLRNLHGMALDWPEREAAKLEELLSEWAEKIHAVPSYDRVERQKVRKSAAAALRSFADQREEALDEELLRIEKDAMAKFNSMCKTQTETWREMCSAAEAEAARLRAEVARQRQLRVELKWRAQEAALSAALGLRGCVRDIAVETEAKRELERLDEELDAKRKEIERLSAASEPNVGESEKSAAAAAEEMAKMKSKALSTLQRAHVAAKKAVEEDTQRRKEHWHHILEERSRDRIKTIHRRRAEEERLIADEAAHLDEDARQAESRRRTTLILGVAHYAEVASLAVIHTVRRGRVLMGLQATAAEAVAEERLPKRSAESAAANKEIEGTADMSATSFSWQVAKRKLGDELNAAVGTVGDLLTEHGKQQRALLTQRQRRETFLAGMIEGEDEKKEDLLDALEENLHREVRAVRWQFEANGAEAMVHRGEGEETGLGRRIASITRDSDLLQQEDEIGERYERLRAIALCANAEVQQRSIELEEQAARLEAEAQADSSDDGESAALGGLPAAGIDEDLDAARRRLEERHMQRSKRREAVLQKAAELMEQGQPGADAKAADLLSNLLEEASAEDGDDSVLDELKGLERDAMMRRLEVLDPDREAQLRRLEARREACRRRREEAANSAYELRSSGKDGEAAAILQAALVETDPGPDYDQIKNLFAPTLNDLAAIDDDRAARNRRLEERLAARGKRRQEVAAKAEKLGLQGELQAAVEAVAEWCRKDSDVDFETLKDSLCAGLEGGLDEDRLAQLKKLEARRAARKRRREEAVGRAEDLIADGELDEAFSVALTAMEAESDADVDQLEGLVSLRAEAIGVDEEMAEKRRRLQEQIQRRKQALKQAAVMQEKGKMPEALALMKEEVANAEGELEAMKMDLERRQEAIEDSRKAQRDKLMNRREARRQRREEALARAEALEASGQVKEALAQIEAVADMDQAPSEGEEDIEAARLLASMDGQVSSLEQEGARQRARLEARQAARAAAKARAAELEAQGDMKGALEVMSEALARDVETIEEANPASLQSDSRKRMQAELTAGAEECSADLADKRRKMQERRKTKKNREEAMTKAAELKKEAAELRLAASQVAQPDGAAQRNEIDAIAAFQAESLGRNLDDGLAASCQKGQEEAARRLLDGAVAAEDAAALKESFEADLERCQAAVASEREAQRKRAQERLQAQRRRREEEKANKAQQQSETSQRVRKRFTAAFQGVRRLQQLHNRRKDQMLKTHAEIERRVRAEVEAEMRALQESATREAEAQVLQALEDANARKAAEEATFKKRESDMRGVRDEEKLRAEEARSLLAEEKRRQAEIIEQKLAKRKQRLERREEKVKQANAIEATQVELTHMQKKMSLAPAEQSNDKRLVKELGQVNALIEKLQGRESVSSPNGRKDSAHSASSLLD